MTGTYTGQFVMNGFLDIRMSLWLRITVTRLIAILPTLIVSVSYRNSKGVELDILNEWLNVLNSVQLPFALVPVCHPVFCESGIDSWKYSPLLTASKSLYYATYWMFNSACFDDFCMIVPEGIV